MIVVAAYGDFVDGLLLGGSIIAIFWSFALRKIARKIALLKKRSSCIRIVSVYARREEVGGGAILEIESFDGIVIRQRIEPENRFKLTANVGVEIGATGRTATHSQHSEWNAEPFDPETD